MSDTIIFILVALICVQFFFIKLVLKKNSVHRKHLKDMSKVITRFHDYYWLRPEFGWIIQPFADYVLKGERHIENIRYDIRVNYEDVKQKIIEESSKKLLPPNKEKTQFSINS